MTINIKFVAVWIAKFNLYLWKRKLPSYRGIAIELASIRISQIEQEIAQLQGKE
jgi:hypothetical protein